MTVIEIATTLPSHTEAGTLFAPSIGSLKELATTYAW